MTGAHLVLVHLSDIHIRYRDISGDYDLDADLRNELKRDLSDLLPSLHHVNGILVTGDTAFAGKRGEYEAASGWLGDLCTILACHPENVWVVPGNHDIDRSVITGSVLLQQARHTLRPSDPNSVDELVSRYLTDGQAGPLLLSPLEEYNRFAVRFGCTTAHDGLVWEDDLKLNDGSILRLWGINSALVSDETDDTGNNKLIVGTKQALPPRDDGVAYLTLCHHPPNWLLDNHRVEDGLNSRAIIQLFGHEHRQRVHTVSDSLRVYAGALHPSRDEPGWNPRYNVLCLCVEGTGDERKLSVNVWARVWNPSTSRFVPEYSTEGEPFYEFALPLDAWVQEVHTERLDLTDTSDEERQRPDVEKERARMKPTRQLVYRFFSLPYSQRMEVALDLHLVSDEDEGLGDTERFKKVLLRAKDQGLLDKLQELVEARYADT